MNLKNRQQLLAFGAAGCIALIAANKFVISPLWTGWSARQTRLAKMKADYVESNRLIGRMVEDKKKHDTWRSNTLTNDTSAAEGQIWEALQRWAVASAITVTRSDPAWKDGETEKQGKQTRLLYRKLEWRVDATGTYASLITFLKEIEKDPMGIRVEAVDINSRDETGRQLQLIMLISGVQLVQAPKAPAAPAATTPKS